MSLAQKLFLIIGLNIMVFIAASYIAFWGIGRLGTALQDNQEISRDAISQMNGDMMHDAIRADVLTALFVGKTKDTSFASAESIEQDLKSHISKLKEAFDGGFKSIDDPQIMKLIDEAKPKISNYVEMAGKLVKASLSENKDEDVSYEEFLQAFSALEESLGQMGEKMEEHAAEVTAHSLKTVPEVKFWLYVSVIVSILLAGISLLLMQRSVIRSIGFMISELRATSGQVLSSATQVSASSQSLAQGATEQAAALEESAASLEISSVSKHNSDHSAQAGQITDTVKSAAQEGVLAMTTMTEAIHSIKTSADETSQIVKIIDEIAFQTNLLALNAAVEAARAGDAGKGFAVVAEEVRNLAQRSAKAARESGEKIRESIDLADNGVKVTEDVAKYLENINLQASKSADLVKDIANSSKEQVTGITQINLAVNELDKVTQQNSAAAEESSAAAQELSAQANVLDGIVENLSRLVYGRQSTRSKKNPSGSPKAKKESNSRPKVNYLVPKSSGISPESKKVGDIINLNPTQIIPLDDNDFQGF